MMMTYHGGKWRRNDEIINVLLASAMSMTA